MKNMFDNHIKLDKKVLAKISFKEKDLYAILALLSLNRKEVTLTPSSLYGLFLDSSKASRNKRTQFIQSIQRLADSKLIKISKTSKIRWNDLITYNCSSILHKSKESHLSINPKDIIKIVECTSMDFQTLLQVYINITSYFNNLDITRADKKELNLDMELYSTLPNISCYASLQTICDTRYSQDENGEHWIAINTLYKAIDALEELKLLSTIKPFKPKGCDQNFTNHYCYPRHTKLCQAIANMRVKRILYQKKLTK